jgi:hypothetical protein
MIPRRRGLGSYRRDSSNDVQFAIAGSLSNVNDTFQSETTALVNAIQAADQMGIGRVIFETDCQS